MNNDEQLEGYTDWDDEKRARYDAARDRLSAAINEMAAITAEQQFPDDIPFVQGWVVAIEFTNVELERDNAGGRYLFSPNGQMLSVSAGLALWAVERHI